MNRKMDDEAVIAKIVAEAREFTLQSDFVACIERMKFYEAEAQSDDVRFSAFITHARCAFDAEDFDEAMVAVSAIDRVTLQPEGKLFADKMLAHILKRQGKLEQAGELLLNVLARPETTTPEFEEDRYDMIGLLGGVLAGLGEYERALTYLKEGESGFEKGWPLDVAILAKAYCLEMLGRFTEAESSLRELLQTGSGELIVDAFYDLGVLYSKMGRFEEAQSMLEFSADNLPHGTRTAAEISDEMLRIRTEAEAKGFGNAENERRSIPFQ